MKKLKNIINVGGFILPSAMMLGVIGMILTLVPFTNLVNREIRLDHRIAKTKARFNAESGLASIYAYFSLDSLGLDTITVDNESFSIDYTTYKDPIQVSENMGSYKSIILQESLNPITRKTERNAFAVGEANITSFGQTLSTLDTMAMSFELESLSEYLYLTNHEHAGGAPGIYGTNYAGINAPSNSASADETWRGKPCFGQSDVIGNTPQTAGYVQTNDPFQPCNATSGTEFFKSTIYVTVADEVFSNSQFNTTSYPGPYDPGEAILPQPYQTANLGGVGCEGGIIFSQKYIEKEKVCFPVKGFWSTYSSADIIIDANRLQKASITGNTGYRDRLIMTDIEFLQSGGFTVKEYWYLIPPYFKATIGDPNETGEITDPNERMPGFSHYLEGARDNALNCHTDGTSGNIGFPPGHDLTECDQYEIPLRDFHGKSVLFNAGGQNGDNYLERYMMTFDNGEAGYDTDQYNQGIPLIYGPKDDDPSTHEFPNGYGNTNLSHYDPFNFHLYYDEQNHYDSNPQSCDNYTHNNNNTTGCVFNGCDWVDTNNDTVDDTCINEWAPSTMIFGPFETPGDPYNGTLIRETSYPNLDEAVILVKGGPVTVHGTYKGRYTVVTSGWDAVKGDEKSIYEGWSTYYRDAWVNTTASGSDRNGTTMNNWAESSGIPVDTVFSNIWITGDLTNADAGEYDYCGGGSPCPKQPTIFQTEWNGDVECPRVYAAGCEEGYAKPGDCGSSENIMGLVSSANVIIAHSEDNRDVATNVPGTGTNNVVGINVHAGIIALHESFVMHYWQHTLNDINNDDNFETGSFPNYKGSGWDVPPLSDNRGRVIYSDDNVGDHRGQLRFWGGIIQSYRGYMKRSSTGPYNGNTIGMDKDYYFDQNLTYPPPYYPTIARCPENGVSTAAMNMISYQPVTQEIRAIYENVD